MDLRLTFLAVPAFLIACTGPSTEQTTTTTPTESRTSYLMSLQGDDGTFVACELGLDSADKGKLVSSRTSAGDWEKFTLYELGDNRVALQAANGKYVSCDENRGGMLVADRDQIGDWETFTLVPQENGKVALQTWNKRYVVADYGLAGDQKGTLFGIRAEAHEWECFILAKDAMTVQ